MMAAAVYGIAAVADRPCRSSLEVSCSFVECILGVEVESPLVTALAHRLVQFR